MSSHLNYSFTKESQVRWQFIVRFSEKPQDGSFENYMIRIYHIFHSLTTHHCKLDSAVSEISALSADLHDYVSSGGAFEQSYSKIMWKKILNVVFHFNEFPISRFAHHNTTITSILTSTAARCCCTFRSFIAAILTLCYLITNIVNLRSREKFN